MVVSTTRFLRLGACAIAAAALAACGGDGGGNSTDPTPDAGADTGVDGGGTDGGGADGGGADGGGADGGGTDGGGTALEIERRDPPPIALTVESTTGCLIDVDCADGLYCFQGACTFECSADDECLAGETCSARGRCESGDAKSLDDNGNAAVPDVWPGIGIAAYPESRIQVIPGQEEVVLTIETTSSDHNGYLLYRAELSRSGDAETGRVRRAQGETEFELVIPTGRAGLEGEEAGTEEVYIVTSVGGFAVDLVPQIAFSGTFGGDVSIPEFGQFGVPIEFQIITDPPTSTLEDADAAYIALPVSSTRIFSPFAALADGPEYVAAELSFDAFSRRYFATFTNRFAFGDASIFGGYPLDQVQRTIRIELESLGNDAVVGQISDRWEGFYDERSTDGVPDVATNTFEGEIYAQRFGPAMTLADAQNAAIGDDEGDPALQPLPPVDACTDAMFGVAEIDVEGTLFACAGIDTVAGFELADVADQAACAIAVTETALAGDTTAAQIAAFLDEDVDNPGGLSFAEFMERCAAGTDGTCRPSGEVLCGRQLVAHAYANQDTELAEAAQLVATYTEVTREAYLGRQLGAFQTDSEMRLTWLRTTDFPAIVTSAVQDLNERLLNEWVENVLDVHLSVLAGQFDASGLAVLSRPPSGEAAQAARQQLLLEMSQSWRASMDALTLAAARWHTLYQAAGDRADATGFVSERMFELYVLSSVLSDLNRSAGAGFNNGTFGGGFSNLMRELEQLSLPFDQLIYARDGEVVVTRSLDPDSTNDDVLDELEALALEEVNDAAEAVGTILAEAEARALNEEQIRNRMNNDIEDLTDELVRLCGLPVGCSRNDVGDDAECEIRVAAGECGFLIEKSSGDFEAFNPGTQNTSAAGRALLGITEAGLDAQIAYEEMRAHNARTAMYLATADAFATQILEWDDQRRALDAEIATLVQNNELQQLAALGDFTENLERQNTLRQAALDSTRASIEEWDRIRIDGVEQDYADLVAVTALEQTAGGLENAAESIDVIAAIVADGMPKVLGTANDTLAPARLAARMSAYGVSSGMRLVATGLNATAAGIENAQSRREAMREVELTNLEYLSDLETSEYDAQVADLEGRLELIVFENEIQATLLQNLIDNLEGALEIEMALERDLIELQDRRNRFLELLQQATEYELRARQAELTIQQRVNEYLQVVQDAQLIAARLEDLKTQRGNVNRLLGSPSVVFAWANRLQQAESRLDRAKDRMMDWVVALEYFAVRPFMDQRLQILLARNTYQLEDIAEELRRLQRSCGGAVNTETAELSLRDDLLGLGYGMTDEVTGETFTAQERFFATLERAVVPIDKRVRYTADSTVGDLVRRNDIYAATFQLTLNDFANLEATCNAKIASIAIQLVGQELGNSRPTVSVLYDGTSQLRSCQPGIDAYVEGFGPEATTFGSVTSFRTSGRAVSPVASLNDFGSANTTLAGLPLASQYTVLIDPSIGENADVNWENIEDIRLRVEYTYQDPFPSGQCE